MRYLTPLLLVLAAVGLFVLYIDPSYQGPGGIKDLQAQAAQYDDALDKSQELKKVRDQLLSRYNTFSAEDKQKLVSLLPDNVDNIRLVIDINNIAARHGLTIKNLDLSGSNTTVEGARSQTAVGTSNGPVGSVDLGFAVTANYDTFLAFIADLEHSLRLVDIENITFGVNSQGLVDYKLSIRTYWLH